MALVFGTMAVHLGLRVLVLEVSSVTDFNLTAMFDTSVLMIAVTAVGSIFGIALAITFGIVKRKQIEILELHRSALDSLHAFLTEGYAYEKMKAKKYSDVCNSRCDKGPAQSRRAVQIGLVQNMSAFLSIWIMLSTWM
ncbi:MAG: hypothetical protein ACI9ON_002802 [Limisphaerales bacterium]|jgi:hypothetical protein